MPRYHMVSIYDHRRVELKYMISHLELKEMIANNLFYNPIYYGLPIDYSLLCQLIDHFIYHVCNERSLLD
jgi:hypothetical protein